MDTEKIQELALVVALGVADEAEMREFQNALKQDPAEAGEELRIARRIVESMAYGLPEQSLPASLKQRLMRNVQTIEGVVSRTAASIRPIESKKPAPGFQFRISRVLAWAAVFLLAALGYGNLSLRDQSRRLLDEMKGLQAQLAERQTTIAQLESQLAQQQRILQVVSSPRLLLVELQSTRPGDKSSGRVMIERPTDGDALRAVFSAQNLPALAADRDYELWYIAGNTPVPAGIFQVNASGATTFEITQLPSDLREIHTFAVSLEPKGGVPQPTGPIVLAGKISA
jgi:hypothetical protein